MKVNKCVEMRLLTSETAATIYRHAQMQTRTEDAIRPDLHGNRCIHVEAGKVCGRAVPKDFAQGWCCRHHQRPTAEVGEVEDGT